jgi:hypothetical protein
MKKFLVLFVLLAVMVGSAFSLDDNWFAKTPDPIKGKQLMISPSFAVGIRGIGGTVAFDYVLNNTPFTLGGSVGFNYWNYASYLGTTVDGYKNSYLFIPLAFRFGWHPDFGVKGLNPYLVTGISPTIYFHTVSYDASYWGTSEKHTEGGLYWWSIFYINAGIRYFFTDKFGVFGEFGWGLNLANIGVTFKF